MSVPQTPETKLIKEVTADESTPPTTKNAGVNLAGYDVGVIQVIPEAGVTPTIEVLSWSTALQTFIPVEPAAQYEGPSAGQAFEVTFSPYGRAVWVRCTNVGAGVAIWMGCYSIGSL